MRILPEGIKSKERVRKYGEVFTPPHIVKDMCDLAEPALSDPEKTALEPACGNGNFLVEILSRKLANCTDERQMLNACKNIYGVDILPDNVRECRERLLKLLPQGLQAEARMIFERNIVQGNFLEPETVWFLKDSLTGCGICKGCGKPFPDVIKGRHKKYCSYACRKKAAKEREKT